MKITKKLLIGLLLIIIPIILLAFYTYRTINKLPIILRQEEAKLEISHTVTSADSEYVYILIVAQDLENGIKKVITPDGLEINASGKQRIGIDYKVEPEKSYIFKAVNGKGEEFEEDIKISYSKTGLIDEIKNINTSGYSTVKIAGKTTLLVYDEVTYNLNTIVYNGDLVLDGQTQIDGATLSNNTYSFGNSATDVATATDYAKNTVTLRVNGNLTINSGVTLTTCNSSANYGGPKGLIISCSGTLTNNGTISMTARGAKAEGENIFLYRNENGIFEYVPAIGAEGGAQIVLEKATSNGNSGNNGSNRQTGGGGTGSGRGYWSGKIVTISPGGAGTSYSGGSGSGAANSDGAYGGSTTSGAGSNVGGAGGNGTVRSGNNSGYGQISIGGTGNPSGEYATHVLSPRNYIARHGTGGLLIIDAETFDNQGTISADGISSSTASRSNTNGRIDTGGASGGGSINIFYKQILNRGTITANGGSAIYGEGGNAGGAGGNGSISIGNISSNSYIAE